MCWRWFWVFLRSWAAYLLTAVSNGLLQQVCVDASVFARICKLDALIACALPRSLHPQLLSRRKLNSSLRHEKHILNGVLPTTNLHPPTRFYRCVSVITALLDCIYRMLMFVSKLIFGCLAVLIKVCDMHCETQFKQQLCKRGDKAQTIWVIAAEVCPYLQYVIFLIVIAVGWIIWLQCALWETLAIIIW